MNISFMKYLWETAFFILQKLNQHIQRKSYFTGAFQAFYTRMASCHSKAFSQLYSPKVICEEVNLIFHGLFYVQSIHGETTQVFQLPNYCN